MDDIVEFLQAVRRHWGSLVTGGALIGILGIWQGVGHSVKPWVYWTIGAVGLAIAFFFSWLDEHKALQIAREKTDELQARLDAIPLKLQIEIVDVFHRRSKETHVYWNADIFLYVCVNPESPQSIAVNYCLDLIAPTMTLHTTQIADIDLWVKTKKTTAANHDFYGQNPEPLYRLNPLPGLLVPRPCK